MSDEIKQPNPGDSKTPSDADKECWEEFAAYAKDRFDAEERRIVDFRGWARQLAAAIAVVIGLETALVAQVLRFVAEDGSGWALFAGTVVLLGTMGYQLWLLFQAIRHGYVADSVLGPEHPSVLIDHIIDCSKAEVRRIIASYYAKAHTAMMARTESIAAATSTSARRFGHSLFAMLAGTVVCALAILWQAKTSKPSPVASSNPPAVIAPSPSPSAAPSTTPSASTAPVIPPASLPSSAPSLRPPKVAPTAATKSP